jgi:cysteine synthase
MRMLGAKVVLTPRAQKGTGMYMKAVELAEKHGWFLARQFETEANADIHEATTAREIMGDFAGDRLDYVVTGYGTGGTVAGLSRAFSARSGQRRGSSSANPPTRS